MHVLRLSLSCISLFPRPDHLHCLIGNVRQCKIFLPSCQTKLWTKHYATDPLPTSGFVREGGDAGASLERD